MLLKWDSDNAHGTVHHVVLKLCGLEECASGHSSTLSFAKSAQADVGLGKGHVKEVLNLH